jgi:hypothetical protein
VSEANALWGAPRIHGELCKLGIDISQATIAKYVVRPSAATDPNGAGTVVHRVAGRGEGFRLPSRLAVSSSSISVTARNARCD